jgi:HSP20 family molecular chaperone IbpA
MKSFFINELIDDMITKSSFQLPTPSNGNYFIDRLDDGRIKLIVNVVGHDPKDVDVEVNEGELTIKSVKGDTSNPFVNHVNLTFTVGREYDGTTSVATIENGILTLTLDKKEEMKSKKIKIKF